MSGLRSFYCWIGETSGGEWIKAHSADDALARYLGRLATRPNHVHVAEYMGHPLDRKMTFRYKTNPQWELDT